MANATEITNLILEAVSGELQVDSQLRLSTISWPSTEPPYGVTIPSIVGSRQDITYPACTKWNVTRSRRNSATTLAASFNKDELGKLTFTPDYNNLLEVFQRTKTSSYDSGLVKIGAFLVDEAPEEAGPITGSLDINARDPMKFFTRRSWVGKLEPDKIEHTNIQMTKAYVQGKEYYEFYHGPSSTNHTVNWTASPSPKVWVRKNDGTNGKPIPIDGTNVLNLSGLGLIRINKSWFDDKYGSQKQINCTYSRYALWEDTFGGTAYNLNSPEDVIETMAKYAGFQDSNTNGLFYIKTIEPITIPRASTGVFKYVNAGATYSDVTSEANNDTAADVSFCAAVNDALYIGVWEQRFCGLHFALSTVMRGGAVVYEYWNGSTWASITPDIDTTNSLTQTGQVIWKNSAFPLWTRSAPNAAMPEAYWVRVRCASAPGTNPVGSNILPGFFIQCATPRYTTFDDMKPIDILSRVVRPFVLPNYYWYCDVDGNFNAKHVYQQATANYTIKAIETIKKEPLRDDQIFTTVRLRGKRYDRFNASASMNGGYITLAPTLPLAGRQIRGVLPALNNGKLGDIFTVYYDKDIAPTEPQDIWILRLAGGTRGSEIYEMSLKSGLSYNLLAGSITGAITWTTDESANTLDYTSSPISLNKVRIRASAANANSTLSIEVNTGEKEWRTVGSITTDDVGNWVEFSGLKYTNALKVRLRIAYRNIINPQSVTVSNFEMYDSSTSDVAGGITWTSNPASAHTAAHDDNISTGSEITQYGQYINANFSAQSINELTLTAAVGSALDIQYKKTGDSNYTLFQRLVGVSKQTLYWGDLISGNGSVSGNSDWTNVTDVRLFLVESGEANELSEIEIYNRDQDDYPTWTIYFTSTNSDNWEALTKGENITPTSGRFSLTKQDFGQEIYPKALKFTVERWANGGSGDNYGAFASEIKVWVGDTIYATAQYGVTFPYTEQEHLDFAAKMGFPTYNLSAIDYTATTQRAAEFNAVQLLRELVRVYSAVSVKCFRPDADLGQTIAVESWIKDRLSLDSLNYVSDEVQYDSRGDVNISLLPFLA